MSEKGTRVIAGDSITLQILSELDVEVIGVPTGSSENFAEYADNEKYTEIGMAMSPSYEDIQCLTQVNTYFQTLQFSLFLKLPQVLKLLILMPYIWIIMIFQV
ncbi:MAG: hypothetical protein WCR27_09760 [Eubacteriales bacterium]